MLESIKERLNQLAGGTRNLGQQIRLAAALASLSALSRDNLAAAFEVANNVRKFHDVADTTDERVTARGILDDLARFVKGVDI